MTDTSIEWCRRPGTRAKTWNPTNGCKEHSPGCLHCYAKTFAARFCGEGKRYHGLVERRGKGNLPMWTGELRFEEHMLGEPLRWRDPCTVFVNSMSDLFMFEPGQIAAVFGVMAACPQHTFIILTKRAEAMPAWFDWLDERIEAAAAEWAGRDCATSIDEARNGERALAVIEAAARVFSNGFEPACEEWTAKLHTRSDLEAGWPLPNVWLGVSCEDRKHGLPRLEHLRRTPAAVRLVSAEPLLEDLGDIDLTDIDWLIAGCESGPGARLCDVAWLRALRKRCAAAGAAFFLKQAIATDLGRCGDPDNPTGARPCGRRITAFVIDADTATYSCGCSVEGAEVGAGIPIGAGEGSSRKPGGIIGAPYLDGRQHLAYPAARAP